MTHLELFIALRESQAAVSFTPLANNIQLSVVSSTDCLACDQQATTNPWRHFKKAEEPPLNILALCFDAVVGNRNSAKTTFNFFTLQRIKQVRHKTAFTLLFPIETTNK